MNSQSEGVSYGCAVKRNKCESRAVTPCNEASLAGPIKPYAKNARRRLHGSIPKLILGFMFTRAALGGNFAELCLLDIPEAQTDETGHRHGPTSRTLRICRIYDSKKRRVTAHRPALVQLLAASVGEDAGSSAKLNKSNFKPRFRWLR